MARWQIVKRSEAYHCALGHCGLAFEKKATETGHKVHDSEVFTGEMCSGMDI